MAGGTSTKNPNQAFYLFEREFPIAKATQFGAESDFVEFPFFQCLKYSRLVVFVEPGIGVIQSYAGKCGDSLVAAYGGNDAAEIEDECFYHDRAVSRKTLQR